MCKANGSGYSGTSTIVKLEAQPVVESVCLISGRIAISPASRSSRTSRNGVSFDNRQSMNPQVANNRQTNMVDAQASIRNAYAQRVALLSEFVLSVVKFKSINL
jgi:hypothetical protein